MLKAIVVILALGVVWGLPRHPISIPTGRIVGGHDTDIKDHPYQLALLLYNQHYCGASIIASEWAVTAAHCVDHGLYTTLAVRAGSTRKSSGGQVVSVSDVTLHPLYETNTANYDFAVLKLAEPITAADAAAIDLPKASLQVEEGQIGTVTGWGTLEYNGDTPEILQAVDVPVVSTTACRRAYGNSRVTEAMFCAGYLEEGGKDACQGDSGGPLVIDNYLAGIVSWGSVCAAPNYPGVYADVAYVVDWITEQMSDPSPDPNPEPTEEPDPEPTSEPDPEPTSAPDPDPDPEPDPEPDPNPPQEPESESANQ